MIGTELLAVIAVLLAVLAAVGVRIALSLKDIGTSLDRIAEGMGSGGNVSAPGAATVRYGPAPAAGQAQEAQPARADAVLEDTEIAAVIAAAARFAGARAGDTTEERK